MTEANDVYLRALETARQKLGPEDPSRPPHSATSRRCCTPEDSTRDAERYLLSGPRDHREEAGSRFGGLRDAALEPGEKSMSPPAGGGGPPRAPRSL